jgi:hypothetical protein
MGGNPGPGSSGSFGHYVGLCSGVPTLDVQESGRLFLVFTCSLLCPFPADVFHPPRNA